MGGASSTSGWAERDALKVLDDTGRWRPALLAEIPVLKRRGSRCSTIIVEFQDRDGLRGSSPQRLTLADAEIGQRVRRLRRASGSDIVHPGSEAPDRRASGSRLRRLLRPSSKGKAAAPGEQRSVSSMVGDAGAGSGGACSGDSAVSPSRGGNSGDQHGAALADSAANTESAGSAESFSPATTRSDGSPAALDRCSGSYDAEQQGGADGGNGADGDGGGGGGRSGSEVAAGVNAGGSDGTDVDSGERGGSPSAAAPSANGSAKEASAANFAGQRLIFDSFSVPVEVLCLDTFRGKSTGRWTSRWRPARVVWLGADTATGGPVARVNYRGWSSRHDVTLALSTDWRRLALPGDLSADEMTTGVPLRGALRTRSRHLFSGGGGCGGSGDEDAAMRKEAGTAAAAVAAAARRQRRREEPPLEPRPQDSPAAAEADIWQWVPNPLEAATSGVSYGGGRSGGGLDVVAAALPAFSRGHLFRVGEAVDCLDVFRSSHTGEIMTKWRFAVVVAAEEEEEDGRLRVRVHFRHWASKWDVWLDTVDDLHRLAPPLSRARAIPASASRRGSSSGGGGVGGGSELDAGRLDRMGQSGSRQPRDGRRAGRRGSGGGGGYGSCVDDSRWVPASPASSAFDSGVGADEWQALDGRCERRRSSRARVHAAAAGADVVVGGGRGGSTKGGVTNGGWLESPPVSPPGASSDWAFCEALRQRGLEVVEVEPDGNCLFRAVGHQIYGDAERHVEVRRACVDHMGRHKARFATFVAEEEFRDYLRRVRQPCVWGDDLEIRALEEVFDRPIHIYSPDAEDLGPMKIDFDAETGVVAATADAAADAAAGGRSGSGIGNGSSGGSKEGAAGCFEEGVEPITLTYWQSHYNSVLDRRYAYPLQPRTSQTIVSLRIAQHAAGPSTAKPSGSATASGAGPLAASAAASSAAALPGGGIAALRTGRSMAGGGRSKERWRWGVRHQGVDCA